MSYSRALVIDLLRKKGLSEAQSSDLFGKGIPEKTLEILFKILGGTHPSGVTFEELEKAEFNAGAIAEICHCQNASEKLELLCELCKERGKELHHLISKGFNRDVIFTILKKSSGPHTIQEIIKLVGNEATINFLRTYPQSIGWIITVANSDSRAPRVKFLAYHLAKPEYRDYFIEDIERLHNLCIILTYQVKIFMKFQQEVRSPESLHSLIKKYSSYKDAEDATKKRLRRDSSAEPFSPHMMPRERAAAVGAASAGASGLGMFGVSNTSALTMNHPLEPLRAYLLGLLGIIREEYGTLKTQLNAIGMQMVDDYERQAIYRREMQHIKGNMSSCEEREKMVEKILSNEEREKMVEKILSNIDSMNVDLLRAQIDEYQSLCDFTDSRSSEMVAYLEALKSAFVGPR